MKHIHLWGVQENNLKDLEVKIPLGSFTVICGPSGSGKSSLAFDTLYAEGQRRYIDSLSNYAKQFLKKAPKPNIEGIKNIPPAIAIEQKNSVKNSRSTVGTSTEVIDYLRLLYEKIGKAYCPEHHLLLEKDDPVSAAKKLVSNLNGERAYLLIPLDEAHRILSGKKLWAQLKKEGYARIYMPAKAKATTEKKVKKRTTSKVVKTNKLKKIDEAPYSETPLGKVINLDDVPRKTAPKGEFYIVIDRFVLTTEDESRIADSLSQAFKATRELNKNYLSGHARVITTSGKQMIFDERLSCSVCNYLFPEISSRLFSFNNPVGACPTCNGFGNILKIDKAKVIPDPSKTIAQGCLKPFFMPSARSDKKELFEYCKNAKVDLHTPWEKLSKKHQKNIWEGSQDFYGVLGLFEYLEGRRYKMHVRVFLARHKSPFTCPDCKGLRLKKEARQVLVNDCAITELSSLTLEKLIKHFKKVKFTPLEQEACKEILRQINSRLMYLSDVGLDYLTLNRETKTLSGGEYQRLNLANQLGMELSQSLYVLDEPTVGLHPRDNDRLISILKMLNNLGNTLVVVEHDHDVIKNSNNILEIGPGSGSLGGEVIYSGPTKEFYNEPRSVTAPYLRPQKQIVDLTISRPVELEAFKYKLTLKGCTGNNLKNVNVELPLNRIVTVTGVSGSGKSSLISDTLYPAVARILKVGFKEGLEYKSLTGVENLKSVLYIDQSPVGKTARSNPATYLKVFDPIRQLMASLPESKAIGYRPGTFSLNVDGGRCPVCHGLGVEVIDMMFMDDIEVLCDTCDGKKYRDEILDVKYHNKNIYEILNLTVSEAMDFFVAYPNIRRPLAVLKEVGLDYIQLGQRASTLSGGESQRLKLARELNLTNQKGTLFILDEPTTGLHFKEVELLIKVLHKLVDTGASVILIEHNLDIVRASDYVIDIGPEAGEKGGKVLFAGPPSELISFKKGHTGLYLKRYIEGLYSGSSFDN